MNYFELISISIGLAMDAFAVSLTAGVRTAKVRPLYALKLAFCFGLFQMIMPIIGWLAGIGFSSKIMSVDKYIAFVLLFIIGVHMVVETYQNNKKPEEIKNKSIEYNLKQIIGLAIATSIDALAVGVTFVCSGVSNISTLLIDCSVIGIITLALCFPAVYLGKKIGSKLASKSGYLGGIILIIVGIKMLIEKLITVF